LRLKKIVVERVTVVKFRVDNRGSNGTGCFRIKVRTDTAELTNMRCSVTYLAKNMVQYNAMSNRN